MDEWVSEWLADASERDPSRFKLHIQSYCGVCLELQILISISSQMMAKTFFCLSTWTRDAEWKRKQGWQKFIFYRNEFFLLTLLLLCVCVVRMRWNDNNGRITQIDELYHRRFHSFHASIVLRGIILRRETLFLISTVNFHSSSSLFHWAHFL